MSAIRYLIAPTEPPTLRAIGTTPLATEKHGCDILGISTKAIVGFQRKTPEDLLASLSDGRLAKQIAQIQSSNVLTRAVLVLEGDFQWTTDGMLLSNYNVGFQKTHLANLLIQIQISGLLLIQTDGLSNTISTVQAITQSLTKSSHQSLLRRPKQSLTSWGTKTSSAFALHLLQSFDGIGPHTAQSIFSTFGRIPLSWDVTETELRKVPGIGRNLAKSIYSALS